MKVTLIDYGAGNVPSVERALRRLGADVKTSNIPEEIENAESLILPGVGHCAALIHSLDAHGLRAPLRAAILRGIPFLGICLGLQALYASSEEAPEVPGLGLVEGKVTRLPEKVKLPHMGWNQLKPLKDSRLLHGVSPDGFFYFAHSYAAPVGATETVAACDYGRPFAAVLERGSLFAVQFHPEKSGAPGAQLLANFLKVTA